MSCIMSHSGRYVTEREELQVCEDKITVQYIIFVCSLLRIYLAITQNNLKFTCECS